MSDHGRDIHRPHSPIERVKVFREGLPIPGEAFGERGARDVFDRFHEFDELLVFARPRRRETHAAIPRHDGGHTVHRRRLQQFVPRSLAVVVSVVIHKAWCHDTSGRIDRFSGITHHDATNLHKPTGSDGDISNDAWGASAIDNGSIADHEVIHTGLLQHCGVAMACDGLR